MNEVIAAFEHLRFRNFPKAHLTVSKVRGDQRSIALVGLLVQRTRLDGEMNHLNRLFEIRVHEQIVRLQQIANLPMTNVPLTSL